MTYSIVARDPDSGAFGVAVQSAYFSVGAVVPWVAAGRVAVHTGESCVAYAGARAGDGWSVQANMMRNDTVPDAMADAYTGTSGDLLDRLLAALDAAEAAGGDVRGQQAAAIVVSADEGPGLRLHVEDHPQPLVELLTE